MPFRSQLYTNAIQAGELVSKYNQSKSDVLNGQQGPWGHIKQTSRGFCAGASVYWIQQRQLGKEFNVDASMNMIPNIGAIVKKHRTQQKSGYENVVEEGWTSFEETKTLLGAASAADITRTLAKGRYWLIRFRRDGGAHCTAFERKATGVIRFFDVNYGEFEFASFERFHAWFYDFVRGSGYHFKYTKDTTLHRIAG